MAMTLSLFGRRVPIGLKIFLATLAVADDLIGITVIAVFYTDSLYPEYLVYAAVLFAVALKILNSKNHYHLEEPNIQK